MSDDEDVGGLRLVGARPGSVRLVGVGQSDLLSPRRLSKWVFWFIGERHVGGVPLRLVGAWTMMFKMMCWCRCRSRLGDDPGELGRCRLGAHRLVTV